MLRRALFGCVVGVALLAAAPSWAQTPGAQSTGTVVRPRAAAMRGRLLRERVGLDEATAQRVEQVLAQYDGQHASAREQIRTSQKRLRDLVRANSADQAAYRQAVDGLRSAQAQQQALFNREFEDLKKILLPSQQAKLLLHLGRLNRGGARGLGPGGGGGRGLGPCGAGLGPGGGGGRGPCGAGLGPGRRGPGQ